MTVRFWIGIISGVILAVLIGLALPYIGVFDVTATGQQNILDWWGRTNLHSALKRRAPTTDIPDAADPARGMTSYLSSCLYCHGGPDTLPEAWADNMAPAPPSLLEEDVRKMTDGELFYIVSNGIRMSGMPAFGPDQNQGDIWNIIAFVRRLDKLTEVEKQQLQQASDNHGHGGGRQR